MNSVYLVVSSLEMQRRLMKTKYTPKLLYCVSKERTHKRSNVGAAKNIFLQCVYCRYNLLWWLFFIPYDHWKTLFFVKVSCYFDIFQPVYYCFLWNKCFEGVHVLCYLHNNSEALNISSQNFVYFTWLTFVVTYFMITFFALFYFVTVLMHAHQHFPI